MNIHEWLQTNQIKNEKGEPIEFDNHPFLFRIYADESQYLTVLKAAQVGMSSCAILKNHFDAKQNKLDLIYTLPTDNDVRIFVGGKVNRIIANNPCMIADVADKDSIEVKQIGSSVVYFRGTFSEKQAIMVTADRLVHDELDSSNLGVVASYRARLQHSKYKQIYTFSHPNLPETGIHNDWLASDQKHWFIKCEACNEWQYLSWSTEVPSEMSVDIEKKIFVCKKCHAKIPDYVRRNGQWVGKYKDKPISGYWVSLLMAPWVSAEEIVKKHQDPQTTPWFFWTRVLGLPYADAASKLLRNSFFQNLTGEAYAPETDERVVMGVDTGLRLDYVLGNSKGLFFHGDASKYEELDVLMERFKKMICVIDAGGDLIGSRAFAEKWTGRVYLCYLVGDRNQNELMTWGKGDEHGSVKVDRNRIIQLCVDEFRNKRIPVHGTEEDWYAYYLDWNNLSKLKVLDPVTSQVKGYKWVRNGRDHRASATWMWRVGMSRFAGLGSIITVTDEDKKPSHFINPDKTSDTKASEIFGKLVAESLDQNDDSY